MRINTLKEQIQQATQWQDRYRCLIQVGKLLPRPTETELSQLELIPGCEAKLYFSAKIENHLLAVKAYSEARIMNGLLALLIETINGKSPNELENFSLTDFFDSLGLTQNLSTSRRTGLAHIEQKLDFLLRKPAGSL